MLSCHARVSKQNTCTLVESGVRDCKLSVAMLSVLVSKYVVLRAVTRLRTP
jgi:hypothetical protein